MAGLPGAEHKGDRLHQQPAPDKSQHLRRSPIQPLRVIDQTQQRTFPRNIRQQTQNRQPHKETIRRGYRPDPEYRPPAPRAALGETFYRRCLALPPPATQQVRPRPVGSNVPEGVPIADQQVVIERAGPIGNAVR